MTEEPDNETGSGPRRAAPAGEPSDGAGRRAGRSRPAPTHSAADDPGPGRSRRWLIWLAAGVAVAVVIGSLLFNNWSGQPTAGGTPMATVSPQSTGSTATRPATASTATSSTPKAKPTSVLPEMAPAKPDERVTTPTKLAVSLAKIEAVAGVAKMPGEIAGPAVRVTVSIKNTGGKSVSLGETVVNGYYGRGRTPADTLTSPGGRPFEGTLKPKQVARGVYLFVVPKDQRSRVTITVDTKAGVPAVVFQGRMG